MKIKRRSFLKGTAAVGAGAVAWTVTKAPYIFARNIAKAQEGSTIKVGILHSLSGTIAIIERSLHNAELLAIEEINAKGGVLGKMIEPIVEDPQSMVQVFAQKLVDPGGNRGLCVGALPGLSLVSRLGRGRLGSCRLCLSGCGYLSFAVARGLTMPHI